MQTPKASPPAEVATLAILPDPGDVITFGKKVLLFLRRTKQVGVAFMLYEAAKEIVGTNDPDPTVPPNEWRKFVVTFSDTTSDEPSDDQQFALHVQNWTSGNVDPTWTTADYDAVAGDITAILWAAIAPLTASHFSLTRIAAYRMTYNDYQGEGPDRPDRKNRPPFPDSGPPLYQKAYTLAATGGSGIAQVCSTLTLETAARAHWGRIYLPTYSVGTLGTDGRPGNAYVDNVATAGRTLLSTLAGRGMHVVVPTTQVKVSSTESVESRVLQMPHGVRVDNVLDIQRRRRLKNATYRKILIG